MGEGFKEQIIMFFINTVMGCKSIYCKYGLKKEKTKSIETEARNLIYFLTVVRQMVPSEGKLFKLSIDFSSPAHNGANIDEHIATK